MEHLVMRYCDLKKKEVIYVKCGQKLGKVVDFEFDECTGKICKLIVSDRGCLPAWLCFEQDYVVPWSNIRQIGPDIVNVEL